METALGKRLTEEQRLELGRRLLARECNLAKALRTIRENRRKYRKWAEGDYSDRKTTNENDIFSKSNIPTEFITGVTDFMVARTCEDIFGSDPYFAAIPQGQADRELAEQVQRHFGYKLREARFVPTARQLIWRGYHLGEGIGKCTWRREEDISEEIQTVLCIPDVEQPVTDANGDYITADDINFLDETNGLSLWAKSEIVPVQGQFAALPDVHPLPVLVGEDGLPVLTSTGEYWFEADMQVVVGEDGLPLGQYLCKSPIVQQGADWRFEDRLVEDRQVIFEGLDDSIIEHDDFTWPVKCRHISEALEEGVFHRLSLTRTQLKENYGVTDDVIDELGGEDTTEKSAAARPQGREEAKGDDAEYDEPRWECFECYIRLPLFENQPPVRIFALVEKKTERVLAIDYLARVTPGAIVPFYFVVPCPMPGRAYGRGYHEIYEQETEFIDRTFNAIIYRNKIHSNPPKFIKEDQFVDAAEARRFRIGYDKLWRLKSTADPRDAVGVLAAFPDLDERTVWILELVMQLVQVRSGVSGAAAGAMTNLPANGTATGVQSIMLSGSTLHKLPIECVKDGIEDALNVNIQILYANQNTEETFAYMEGDAMQLITFNPRTVKNLKLNVRLLLTRLHERESLEAAKAAIAAVAEYIALPEAEKEGLRPLFIQVLKALRIQGADAILRRALPPDPNAKPPQQERFTESLNYKDVPPSIKRQMEAAAGYTPATEDEEEAGKRTAETPEEPPLPENAA